MHPTLRSAVLAILLVIMSAAARAEITLCTTIAALPHTITAPGIYCLKNSLNAAGNAITVNADDVVLDLNGHALNGNGTGVGVGAADRSRVTVRNGTIRGFVSGVQLTTTGKSEGHVVEDLRLEANRSVGVEADGRGVVVRNNLIIGTGTGAGSGVFTIGIFVNGGSGAHVHDNQIVDMSAANDGEADAIRVFKSPGTSVQRNVVSNSFSAGPISYGITFVASAGNTAVGNRVYNMAHGIAFSLGGGLYMDNTVGGAASPYAGGTAAGGTNFVF